MPSLQAARPRWLKNARCRRQRQERDKRSRVSRRSREAILPGYPGQVQPDTVLGGPPVGSIVDLLDRMAAIDAALPAADGLACFNRMYRLVTLAVQQHLDNGSFADPAWMARLD